MVKDIIVIKQWPHFVAFKQTRVKESKVDINTNNKTAKQYCIIASRHRKSTISLRTWRSLIRQFHLVGIQITTKAKEKNENTHIHTHVLCVTLTSLAHVFSHSLKNPNFVIIFLLTPSRCHQFPIPHCLIFPLHIILIGNRSDFTVALDFFCIFWIML